MSWYRTKHVETGGGEAVVQADSSLPRHYLAFLEKLNHTEPIRDVQCSHVSVSVTYFLRSLGDSSSQGRQRPKQNTDSRSGATSLTLEKTPSSTVEGTKTPNNPWRRGQFELEEMCLQQIGFVSRRGPTGKQK